MLLAFAIPMAFIISFLILFPSYNTMQAKQTNKQTKLSKISIFERIEHKSVEKEKAKTENL